MNSPLLDDNVLTSENADMQLCQTCCTECNPSMCAANNSQTCCYSPRNHSNLHFRFQCNIPLDSESGSSFIFLVIAKELESVKKQKSRIQIPQACLSTPDTPKPLINISCFPLTDQGGGNCNWKRWRIWLWERLRAFYEDMVILFSNIKRLCC